MSRTRRERGAAAVEMAIILPVLLLVIGGIVDFGRAFYYSVVTTSAAREGARMLALGYTTTQADARVTAAMPGPMTYTRTPAAAVCPNAAETATYSITITNGAAANQFHWLVLSLLPQRAVPVPTIRATGSMRCNG